MPRSKPGVTKAAKARKLSRKAAAESPLPCGEILALAGVAQRTEALWRQGVRLYVSGCKDRRKVRAYLTAIRRHARELLAAADLAEGEAA